MKLPDKIDIVGLKYNIVYTKTLKEDIQEVVKDKEDAGDYSGYCYMNGQTIWIDDTMSREQKERTLVHEIIESIGHILAIRLKHRQIEALEHGIYYVFQNNKLFKE